jgi:hypothetical protein
MNKVDPRQRAGGFSFQESPMPRKSVYHRVVKGAIRADHLRVVTADYMMKRERPLPLPLFDGLVDEQNRREVEYHRERA